MDYLWTSLKKYHKLILFLSIILLIGFVSGFIYFSFVKNDIVIDLKSELFNLEYNWINILYHGIILAIIILFSCFIIGNFIGFFVLFFEAMSIGFLLNSFLINYGISGLIYGIIYFLLFKVAYLLCLMILLINLIYLTKNIIGYFLLKKDGDLKELAIKCFLKALKMLGIIMIIDLFLLIVGKNIIGLFSFLIS